MKLDILKFTEFSNKKVYWWAAVEKADVNDVLATILAKHTPNIEKEARALFGFTDADFIQALKHAPVGLFESQDKWDKVTMRFGLKLQYPQRSQRDIFITLNKHKQGFEEKIKDLDKRTAELIALAQEN